MLASGGIRAGMASTDKSRAWRAVHGLTRNDRRDTQGMLLDRLGRFLFFGGHRRRLFGFLGTLSDLAHDTAPYKRPQMQVLTEYRLMGQGQPDKAAQTAAREGLAQTATLLAVTLKPVFDIAHRTSTLR